jgi:hypothetical protein
MFTWTHPFPELAQPLAGVSLLVAGRPLARLEFVAKLDPDWSVQDERPEPGERPTVRAEGGRRGQNVVIGSSRRKRPVDDESVVDADQPRDPPRTPRQGFASDTKQR